VVKTENYLNSFIFLFSKVMRGIIMIKQISKRFFWKLMNTIEHIFEVGWRNLLDVMETKPHQQVVWDGVVPTKRTPRMK